MFISGNQLIRLPNLRKRGPAPLLLNIVRYVACASVSDIALYVIHFPILFLTELYISRLGRFWNPSLTAITGIPLSAPPATSPIAKTRSNLAPHAQSRKPSRKPVISLKL
jgi:hypothetical protein